MQLLPCSLGSLTVVKDHWDSPLVKSKWLESGVSEANTNLLGLTPQIPGIPATVSLIVS